MNINIKRISKSIGFIISILGIILISFAFLSFDSFAETSGDYEYVVLDGEATITKYLGSDTEIIIPSEIGGYKVTSIGGSGITSVGAFKNCSSIISVTIPNSVTSIGSETFYGCSALKNVNIPNGVVKIHSSAFQYCKSLISVTIPNSVSEINQLAFADCESLTDIFISSGVTYISSQAFSDCLSLKDITVDSLNAHYKSIDGVLFSKDLSNLIQYPCAKSDESYSIPNGVSKICNSAFSSCHSLENITIPNSVVTIGDNAFLFCKNLTDVVIPNSVTSIGYNAFLTCNSLININIPESVIYIGSRAFHGDSLVNINVDLSNPNFTSVDGVLFNKDLSALIKYPCGKTDTSYSIPDGVSSIGDDAFERCEFLLNVEIPNSVISIGQGSFQSSNIQKLVIPESVTTIGNNAFASCGYRYLDYAIIHDNITTIGNGAFDSNTTLYYHITNKNWVGDDRFTCSPYINLTIDLNYDNKPENQTVIAPITNNLITAPEMPEREGFLFDGWYTDISCADEWDFATDTAKNDLTLYAKWNEIFECAVMFETNGGSSIEALTVLSNSTITEPVIPTKTGYTFDGWYKDESLINKWNFETDVVTGTITLYAKWNANEYRVNLYNVGIDSDSYITVKYGEKYSGLTNLTKTGYEFLGWYTSTGENGIKIQTTTNVDKPYDHNLYAKWKPVEYYISFETRGGNYVASKRIAHNTAIGSLPVPERYGYEFTGWVMASTSGNINVTADTVFDGSKSSYTLYATWKLAEFNIYFNANGGNASPENKVVTFSKAVGILPTPTKFGQVFCGWYTTSNGTGTNITANTLYNYNEDMTLYAKWSPLQLTVSFDSQGGSSVSSKTVSFDSAYGTLVTPTKKGYGFVGWYTLPNGGQMVGSKTICGMTYNHTLYARWNKIEIIYPTKIKINNADSMSYNLKSGETATLTATVYPQNANDKRVEWRSSNTNVVTVSGNGVIKAIAPGDAYVYAKAKSGGVENFCRVFVVGEQTSKPETPMGTYPTLNHKDAVELLNSVGIDAYEYKLLGKQETDMLKFLKGTLNCTNEDRKIYACTILTNLFASTDNLAERYTKWGTDFLDLYKETAIDISGGDPIDIGVNSVINTIGYFKSGLSSVLGTGWDLYSQINSMLKWGDVVNRFIDLSYGSKNQPLSEYVSQRLEGCSSNEAMLYSTVFTGSVDVKLGEYLYQLSLACNYDIKSRTSIHCPVNLAVYDSSNNQVLLVTDEMEGTTLTDFGRFCVIPNGDGSYSKVAELYSEDYTVKIIGTDDGTMSYEYVNFSSDVPVIANIDNVSVSNGKEIAVIPNENEVILQSEDFEEIMLKREAVPENIEFEEISINLDIGQYIYANVEVKPINTLEDVVFSSSNPAVANVSDAGKIIGVSDGTAIITASIPETGISASCSVTVSNAIAVTELYSVKEYSEMFVGESIDLDVLIYPVNATYQEITWSSSNDEVATVSSEGVVTGISTGSVLITAYTKYDNVFLQFELTVAENKYGLTVLTEGDGTVNISSLDATGSQIIELVATESEDNFVKWVASEGGIIDSPESLTTIFIMPYNHATVTAIFEDSICSHSNVAAEWSNDILYHWYECNDCGTDLDKTTHTSSGAATEDTAETCTVCGYIITPATGHITHTADTSKWLSDGTNHWHRCVGCEEKMDVTAHSGGVANCTSKAKCEICETKYGAVDSTNHANKSVNLSNDETGHWYVCDCGKVDFSTHTSSGAATETTPETCKICDYVITPAIGHITHIADTSKWLSDSTEHWHKCKGCEEKMDTATHTSDDGKITTVATATTDGVKTYSCTVCGYVIKTETIPATGSSSGDTPVVPPTTGRPSWVTTPVSSTTTTTTTTTKAPVDDEVIDDDIYEDDDSELDEDTDTTKPADDGTEPQIKGEDDKTGWDVIADEIADADDSDKIVVDMNGTTGVPEDIFEQIQGQDIDLVIELDNGFTWTINGESVTEPMDIDLGVNEGATIPVKVINEVTGECSYITITLTHNGEFGFTAVLTVDMGDENEGLYANLYWYTDGETEFICADKINSKGKADLTFTHASEYIIVIDETNHGKRVEVSDDETEENNDTIVSDEDDSNPETGVIFCFGSVIISATAVVIARKRKNK